MSKVTQQLKTGTWTQTQILAKAIVLLTTWFFFCFTSTDVLLSSSLITSKVFTFTCFKLLFSYCVICILFSNFCKVVGAILFTVYFLPIKCIGTTFTQEAQVPCWWPYWTQFIRKGIPKKRKGIPSLSPSSCQFWAEYKYILESYHAHIFSTLFTHTTWLLVTLEHPTISESEDPMSPGE